MRDITERFCAWFMAPPWRQRLLRIVKEAAYVGVDIGVINSHTVNVIVFYKQMVREYSVTWEKVNSIAAAFFITK